MLFLKESGKYSRESFSDSIIMAGPFSRNRSRFPISSQSPRFLNLLSPSFWYCAISLAHFRTILPALRSTVFYSWCRPPKKPCHNDSFPFPLRSASSSFSTQASFQKLLSLNRSPIANLLALVFECSSPVSPNHLSRLTLDTPGDSRT